MSKGRPRLVSLPSICCLFLLLIAVALQPPPARNQPQQKAPAAPVWVSINVVNVKPEMLTEWQDMQRNETIPALKKGGIKWRNTFQTAIFGPAYEYVFATPIEDFARYDGERPIAKALGQEGARTYGAKMRRFIEKSHTYAVLARGDLSYFPDPNWRPKLTVINFVSVAPGRMPEYETYLKNDVLPVLKKVTDVKAFAVSQIVLGGDGNAFVTATAFNTFADIGKGSPFIRALGEAGANKLLQKTVGVVARVERIVARYNPELSFEPAK